MADDNKAIEYGPEDNIPISVGVSVEGKIAQLLPDSRKYIMYTPEWARMMGVRLIEAAHEAEEKLANG